MSKRLEGIFTPNLVLLDDRGKINEAELRRYTDWLIEQGVHGLYPNGSTGEFLRFTADERRRIVAIIADQTAGRVPILAGAAEANVNETLSACEYYHSLGVRAVAIVAPYYYRLQSDAVYAYFKQIADQTPIDVTLYNIPMFASPIEVDVVRRLAAECPRVIGIKDSSGDLPHMMRMIAAVRPIRDDFSFLTGWEAAMLPMLMIGCDGGTHATSGIVPELTRQIFELARAGRYGEAVPLQYSLLKLFDAMIQGCEFPDGFRVGLRLRGFQTGLSRQPQSAEQRSRLSAISNQLRQLLASGGYLNSNSSSLSYGPGVTAPVVASQLSQSSSANLNTDQVEQIVSGVLAQLQQRGLLE